MCIAHLYQSMGSQHLHILLVSEAKMTSKIVWHGRNDVDRWILSLTQCDMENRGWKTKIRYFIIHYTFWYEFDTDEIV